MQSLERDLEFAKCIHSLYLKCKKGEYDQYFDTYLKSTKIMYASSGNLAFSTSTYNFNIANDWCITEDYISGWMEYNPNDEKCLIFGESSTILSEVQNVLTPEAYFQQSLISRPEELSFLVMFQYLKKKRSVPFYISVGHFQEHIRQWYI